MKVITIYGNLKFRNEVMKVTEEMTLQGNYMLSIIYPTNSDIAVYTREKRELLGDMHKERIRISDVTLVMGIDHYIGGSIQDETEFVRASVEEIIYYTDAVGTM